MLRLLYLCVLRRKDGFKLFQQSNLDVLDIKPDINKKKEQVNIDYYQTILDLDLDFRRKKDLGSGNSTDAADLDKEKKDEAQIGGKVNNDNINDTYNNKDNNIESNDSASEKTEKILKDVKEFSDIILKKDISKKDDLDSLKENIPDDLKEIEDIENFLCSIPKEIKQTISIDKKDIDLYYHFVIGNNCVIISVSKSSSEEIRPALISFIRTFEKMFDKDTILYTKAELFSPRIQVLLSICLVHKTLNSILIPYLIPFRIDWENEDEQTVYKIQKTNSIRNHLRIFLENISQDLIIEKNELVYSADSLKKLNNITQLIDGLNSIKIIAEKINIESDLISVYLYFLFLRGEVWFQKPVYDWDVLDRTYEANKFLYDGSEEQKMLISYFGGGKIISLLSKIDGNADIYTLKQNLKIPDIKLLHFVYQLIRGNIIQIKKMPLIFEPLTEDTIPLLVLRGIEDNIDFLETLYNYNNKNVDVTELALRYDIDPHELIKMIRILNTNKRITEFS